MITHSFIKFFISVAIATVFVVRPILPSSDSTTEVYIPLVSNLVISPTHNIGVENESSWESLEPWYNRNTLLKIGCSWNFVESVYGVYDWEPCDRKIEPGMHPFIVVFKTTPVWARNDPSDLMCKLPSRKSWPRAARFVQELAYRYYPDYIEIWNEPDALHKNEYYAQFFGCVGDGALYAEFYEYLRNTVVDVELIAGAVTGTKDNQFVDDMFTYLGDNLDAFSFHCYPWYYNGVFKEPNACLELYNIAKAYTDKPVHITETGSMYKSGPIQMSPYEYSYEQSQIDNYLFLKTLPAPTVSILFTGTYNGWPVCEPIPCNVDLITIDPITQVRYPRPVWFLYIQE